MRNPRHCASLLVAISGLLAVRSSAGPIILSGHDPDDHGFVVEYVDLFDQIYANVSNGNSGIISVGSDPGSTAGDWIEDVASMMAVPQTVTHVNGAAILAVDFSTYAIIHVPSDNADVAGGITQVETNDFATRSGDVGTFINTGGGLFGLTGDDFDNAYAYLGAFVNITYIGVPPSGICNDMTNELWDDVTPTAEGSALGITATNIDGCCWHNVFTSFAPFLEILANANEPNCPSIDGIPSVIGCLDCVIPNDLELTPPLDLNPPGTQHTVVATLLESVPPFDPVPGVLITFEVIAGPNVGATDTDTTDANGEAEFTYTSNGMIGVDQIRAWYLDTVSGTTVYSVVVLKFWDVDCQPNGIPDTCDLDCRAFDFLCEAWVNCGDSEDADMNNIPDECPICGDGVVGPGEQCDDGNLINGDCCSDTCQFEPAFVECRASTGVCDPAEFCDGMGVCPPDVLEPDTTECRASTGVCDPAEFCTGMSPDCPPDALEPDTTECRASAGACDVPEFCTGMGPDCPPDAVEPNATECRGAAGFCDVAEFCNGIDVDCPPDGFEPDTTECRPSAGVCDAPEFCTGLDADCPPDGFAPDTTECRASAGDCDVAEFCSGIDVDCPPDGFEPDTTVCRPAVGPCDATETCPGDGVDCPPDEFAGAGVPCPDDGNECTDDTCDGNGLCDHPVNGLCGACCLPGGVCNDDVLEATCDVLGGTFTASGTLCGTDSDGDGVDDPCDQCPGVDDNLFAPGCAGAIPTVSEWGVVILALMLLVGAKLGFGRRPAFA